MEIIKAEIKENKMEAAPVSGLITGMAVPATFSMVVQALYNIVDSFFVAKISQETLTAVSLVFLTQLLLVAFGVGIGAGVSSLVSRRLGGGRRKEVNSTAAHGLPLGLVNWVLSTPFGLFSACQFIEDFSTDLTATVDGIRLVRIIPIFSFGVFVEINVEKTLQATGNMICPTAPQPTGVLTSLIPDPTFIFGQFSTPATGVPGAATANVLTQRIAMYVPSTALMRKRRETEVNLHSFRLDLKIVRDIYTIDIPTVIMQSIMSVMVIGMNLTLVRFTDTAVALFGVYFKLQSFVSMPVFGPIQGMMPILGYNYGTRRQPRIVQAIHIDLVASVLIVAVGILLFWVVSVHLLLIFEASPEMVQIGAPAL